MYVYVAGPLTSGAGRDVTTNIRAALEAANRLYEEGHYPYVPHLTHFWHFAYPDTRGHEESKWMKLDRAWLERCEAVLRLPGVSMGANIEVGWAIELGLPVFTMVTFPWKGGLGGISHE